MRHRVAQRKLGRTTPHRAALLRNLATSFFEKERIRTTIMKAKELRPFAEKLITLAKREDGRLHARRLVLREIKDPVVVKKLFDQIGSRFAGRPGGYTRILRLGVRRGDGAEMAILEMIGSEYQPKKTEKAPKPEKGDKGDKAEKAGKPEKAEKAEKAPAKPAAKAKVKATKGSAKKPAGE